MVDKRDFLKIINLYTVKKMSKDEMEALHDLKSTLKKNVQDSIEVIFYNFFFKIDNYFKILSVLIFDFF